MVTKFFLLIFGFITINLFASSVEEESPKITTQHTTYLAKVKGYMQTPIGGTPGTSDVKRPTFTELGIKNVLISDELISLQWKSVTIYAGYQRIRPKSHSSLISPLRTYGESIPANTVFTTDNRFDGYRLGIALPMTITDNLTFTPKLEIAVLDFDYHFRTEKLDKHRGYHHLTLRAGKSLIYHLSPHWGFQFESLASLPLLKALDSKSMLWGLRYRQSQISYSQQKLDFEDGQALPNHLALDTKALIAVPLITEK